MTDIHIHILPAVDDGSEDMEDSILMAQLAVEGGVDSIIATPHGNLSEGHDRDLEEEEHTDLVRDTLEEFRAEIARRGIPLTVYPGMEIFSTPDAADLLREGTLLPMCGGPFCLMEFGFEDPAYVCKERIGEMLELGYRPIIAHPERYECVQRSLKTALDWIYMGCQLQANRGSILGRFGKKPHRTVWEMLRQDMLTYIGSDAHSPYARTPYMMDVYEILSEDFSPRMAQKLLDENAHYYLLDN